MVVEQWVETLRRCAAIFGHTGRMGTLHLVDGPSAAAALRVALSRSADRADDSVAWFPDELSAGPLEPDDPAVRVEWWQWWAEMVAAQTGSPATRPASLPGELTAFWERIGNADHLVVWYGRNNAGESSFFHALCDKLPDRALDVVALPGAVAACTPDELSQHIATARPIAAAERSSVRETWRRLRRENQAFRTVRGGELVSAPADHYDNALLNAASSEWTPIARTIAPVMAGMDVGDSPLIWRVKTLVDSGALVADGDPWLARQTNVKRPEPQGI